MIRYLVPVVLLISCSKQAPPKKVVRDLSKMQPSTAASQTMEGRLTFAESLVVLGKGATRLKSFTASVSGVRQHKLFKGTAFAADTFAQAKVITMFNMKGVAGYLDGLRIMFPVERSEHQVHLVAKAGEDHFKLSRFFAPLWQFMHTLPPLKGQEKIRKGLTFSFTDTAARMVHGKRVPIIRKFTFTISNITHTGQLHYATLRGTSLSTSQRPLTLGHFTVEIIGRGTMEAEFSLDRGVWTHIKGREILGWAGTYRKSPTDKPVTTGYRQELTADLYLTENQ